jgi:hypothetical protein
MKLVTQQTLNEIWDILVEEAGASPSNDMRFCFVTHAMSGKWTEFRFGGKLGHGGKVWDNCGRIYVTAYSENETPEVKAIIERTNERLKQYNYEKSYYTHPSGL